MVKQWWIVACALIWLAPPALAMEVHGSGDFHGTRPTSAAQVSGPARS